MALNISNNFSATSPGANCGLIAKGKANLNIVFFFHITFLLPIQTFEYKMSRYCSSCVLFVAYLFKIHNVQKKEQDPGYSIFKGQVTKHYCDI